MKDLMPKLKKFQRPAERFLFPLILLVWPLIQFRQGLDLADTTYSLSNYAFLGKEGTASTWYFATFLANRVGSFLLKIAPGGSLAGMNLLTGLLISVTALAAYHMLHRMMPGWMAFLGEMAAVSLCWCPTVILYNTLTYVFVTLAVLFLFMAVSSVPENRVYFVLAGLCLGLNVLVRFSNLPQAALILAVWFHAAVIRRKSTETLRITALCLLGYAAGLLLGMIPLMLRHGAGAWFAMIPQLFSMTKEASDYTMLSMLASTLDAYGHTMRWILIMLPCVAAGIVMFRLPMMRGRRMIARILYLAGIVILFRFFYGRGMFTVNYQDYWCMFEWGMVWIILTACLSLIGMTGRFGGGPDEQFLSAAVLLLILITPLGSNNYTFPVLNNMFIIAPFGIWMLRRYWQEARRFNGTFAWNTMALACFAMLLAQGMLFHAGFAFGDGTDGTKRSAVMEAPATIKGMHTTPANAQEIAQIADYFADHQGKLLAYGNIPGLHYVLSMEPVLSNLWPDLDSYPAAQMQEELAAAQERGDFPAIVVSGEMKDRLQLEKDNPSESGPDPTGTPDKAEMLKEFLTENGYRAVHEQARFTVYETAGRQ